MYCRSPHLGGVRVCEGKNAESTQMHTGPSDRQNHESDINQSTLADSLSFDLSW